MSEDYREETQGEIESDSGSSSDHNAEMNIGNFVWEDVLEEIGRYDNFNVDMPFTWLEWRSFSKSLQNYITAKRLLSKVTNEQDSNFIVPNWGLNAKSIVDANVTVRPSLTKTEQTLVEPSDEETGSSMQRIASNLMQASDADRSCIKEVVTTSEFPVDDSDRPGDFEDLMEMVVLKKDFKNSMDIISQRLEQIPHDLDVDWGF